MAKIFMTAFQKVKSKTEKYIQYDAKAHFYYLIHNAKYDLRIKNQTSVTQHKLIYYTPQNKICKKFSSGRKRWIQECENKKCKKFSSGRKRWIQEYTNITENRNGLP